MVAILYCHNSLISLVRLDCQRKLLMRTDVKRRESWEWSDHTPLDEGLGVQPHQWASGALQLLGCAVAVFVPLVTAAR